MAIIIYETFIFYWKEVLTSLFFIYMCKKLIVQVTRTKSNQDDHQTTVLPPISPIRVFELIKYLGRGELFLYLPKISRELNSDIFRLYVPTLGPIFMIASPKLMRKILTDKTSDKPRKLYKQFEIIPGSTTLFASITADPKCKSLRKGIVPAFSGNEVQRMKHICSRHVAQWINETLEPCIQNNESFDPSREMCRITFTVLLEAAFEYTDPISSEEYQDYTKSLERALKEFMRIRPLGKLYRPFFQDHELAVQSCAKLQEFSRKILLNYQTNPTKSTNKTVIRLICENPAITSDKDRIGQITGLILGGHETSGFSIATALILLAKHPNVSSKLRQELISLPLFERHRSPYLKQVLMESNRIVPVATTIGIRVTGRDFVHPKQSLHSYKDPIANTNDKLSTQTPPPLLKIPKGSICFFPQHLANKHTKYYPKPKQFLPERWENPSEDMKEARLGFSAGPRNCVGQALAIAQLYCVIPKLISGYDFDLIEEGKLQNFLTLKFIGARLKPRRVATSLTT